MNIKELIEDLQLHFPASDPKEVAKALLAQQAVIEKMREALLRSYGCYPPPYSKEPVAVLVRSALALQPDLSALREHDAAVRANERQKMLEDLKLLADDHGRVNLWEVE